MQVDAIIVAAGSSQRFGPGDKLLADLAGRPVLAWSLAAHADADAVSRVIVVAHPERMAEVEALAGTWSVGKPWYVVAGGPRRRDSVEAGLNAATTDYVSIHDGARPLVSVALIDRCVALAQDSDGAVAAAPVTDTIKEVTDGIVTGHPGRTTLWAVQTPQVVRRGDWLAGAALSPDDETDDTAMIARVSRHARVVENLSPNLKITTAADLAIAEALLAGRVP